MTIPDKESRIEGPAAEVFSAEVWQVANDTIGDPQYGVPEDLVSAVREDLFAALKAQGIDPQTMWFSGYSGKPHDKDEDHTATVQSKQDLVLLLAKIGRLEHSGRFDEDPSLRERYKQEIIELKTRSANSDGDTYDYYFSDADGLSKDTDGSLRQNPIHFAGTAEPTIAVFDPALMDAEDRHASLGLTLTPEALDAALVMRYHPRYVDETGTPIAANS